MPGPMTAKEKAELKAKLEQLTTRIGKFEDKYGGKYEDKPAATKSLKPELKPAQSISTQKKAVPATKKKKPYYKGITNKNSATQLRDVDK